MEGLFIYYVLRKSDSLLKLRRSEKFSVSNDARQINATIYPDYNEKFYSMNFIAQMNFVIENITIFNRSDALSGGAIQFVNPSWKNPTIGVKNCTYKNVSSGIEGGAGYIIDANDVFVTNSLFEKTNSSYNGGTLYIGNAASSLISNTKFYSGKSIYSNGGALYMNNIESSSISGSEFKSCNAGASGGGAYIHNSEKILIDDSIFESTVSAKDGGGAFLINSSIQEVSGSQFINCNSNGNGGSVCLINSTIMTIENVTLKNCISQKNGSLYLMSLKGSMVSITNSKIIKSRSLHGGSIFTQFANGSLIQISNLTIEDSLSTYYGGTLYSDIGKNSSMEIDRMTINKTSGSYGGALYIQRSNNVNITNSKYINSISSSNGGSLYLDDINSLTVDNLTIIGSVANSNGGIQYSRKVQNIRISNSEFRYGSSPSGSLGGCLFIEYSNDQIIIENTHFAHCCSGNGGAIYIRYSDAFLLITESNFHNCSSNNYGGAILYHNCNSKMVTLTKNCIYYCNNLNSNGYYGKVIYLNLINDCKFIFNMSSFANSYSEEYNALYFEKGIQEIMNMNCSYNGGRNPIFHKPTGTCNIVFLTYTNNSLFNSNHLVLDNSLSTSSTILLSYSNFIQNRNGNFLLALNPFRPYGIMVSNCIFQKNTQTPINSSSAFAHIFNCIFDNITNTSTTSYCMFERVSSGITSTHSLIHLSTFMCHAPQSLSQLDQIPCQTLNPILRTYDDFCDLQDFTRFSLKSISMLPIYISIVSLTMFF